MSTKTPVETPNQAAPAAPPLHWEAESTAAPDSQEQRVRGTFDEYWDSFAATRFDAQYQRLAERPAWFRAPFTCGPAEEVAFLRRRLGDLRGKRILEFGSGIGWTSLALAREGAEVTLADISSSALRLSRRAFARAGLPGIWVRCSIFDPAPQLEQYDAVFNSGLIEHFQQPDQIALLRAMRGLTVPGGLVVAVAPYAGARLYRWAKRRMEAAGTWRFGDEFPMATMRPLAAPSGLEVVEEWTTKPGDQANFLWGCSRWLGWAFKCAYLATGADATPLWRWLIGDSMIATALRRPV